MSLTPEAKQTLLAQITALDELPIERIVGILGGADPKEFSPLYRHCQPIELTPSGLQEARAMVDKMGLTLKRYRELTTTGRALAANQIGIEKAITVFLSPEGEIVPYLNPEITWTSPEQNVYWEMCISGSPLGVDVARPESVKVRFQDLEGNQHEELLEGFDARRMQHEIEHLGGKVCYNTDGTVFTTLGYRLNSAEYMNQKLRSK